MSGSDFTVAGGGGVLTKNALDQAFYTFDYTQDLAPGDYIIAAAWTVGGSGVSPDVTIGPQFNDNTTASARLIGGVGGTWYLVTNSVQTYAGDTLSQSVQVYVKDPSTLGAGIISCFPSLSGAVASIRRDRLFGAASTYFPDEPILDDYILEKLVAAEADVQRRLRVYLSQRQMVPAGTDDQTIATLTAANGGLPVVQEPGYDYLPSLFEGNSFGLIELRQKPATQIQQIQFVYPTPQVQIYTIPIEWVRLDPKKGWISLVPVQTSLALPLNAFILSALGGGQIIPLMLQVTYIAGIPNVSVDYPDVLDVIKKAAVLSIIDDRYVPGSGSVSADGLSQSVSMQMDKYTETIDKKIAVLRRSIDGIPMFVF
jgi:hypothetical protein